MAFRLAIDIGGTFTDFVLIDETTGQRFVGKSLTTPQDPTQGVAEGLAELLRQHDRVSQSIAPLQVHIIHATTLITNTIIERTGARVGLITTAGFRDLLEIGREVRYDLYDLFLQMPEPLVPRALRLEARERIDAHGEVVTPLDLDDVRRAADELVAQGVTAVAVVLLHAYRNSTHERLAREAIAEAHPGLSVCISSDVAPEIREFERLSTTVANAYVQPLAARYFPTLRARLAQAGVDGSLHIMLSNGGVVSAETARDLPVRLVESGPAAGALIAGHVGSLAGEPRVLAFDMGGTTAKLCLVDDGVPTLTYGLEVARVHRFKRGSGLPLRVPSIELIEIGAGGGSIASLDALGLLSVGPRSASSEPGPACYGFGGTQPTVTDADLLLGFLNPDFFLGGRMRLDATLARRAIEQQVSDPLGLDAVQVAWGIHDMVNENMATAASVYIAEKGQDPRRYTLVATGGAGPVHAVGVARKIGLGTVLIPPSAGVASAAGLLVAPPRMDFSQSQLIRLADVDPASVDDIYRGMEQQGRTMLAAAGVPSEWIIVQRMADMRYANQGHEVTVPFPADAPGDRWRAALTEAFESVYTDLYGRLNPGVPVEVVTWRLTVTAPAASLPASRPAAEREPAGAEAAVKGSRPAYFPDPNDFLATTVYDRDRLPVGSSFVGPAIVEEAESTVVVGPSDRATIDTARNLVITLGGGTR